MSPSDSSTAPKYDVKEPIFDCNDPIQVALYLTEGLGGSIVISNMASYSTADRVLCCMDCKRPEIIIKTRIVDGKKVPATFCRACDTFVKATYQVSSGPAISASRNHSASKEIVDKRLKIGERVVVSKHALDWLSYGHGQRLKGGDSEQDKYQLANISYTIYWNLVNDHPQIFNRLEKALKCSLEEVVDVVVGVIKFVVATSRVGMSVISRSSLGRNLHVSKSSMSPGRPFGDLYDLIRLQLARWDNELNMAYSIVF